MIDVEEIKTKLIQDYRRLWINRHKFEINDDEVDMEDCVSQMGYIVEMLIFITGWSREAVYESLGSHINYIIEFNPADDKSDWELSKFDCVETQEDIYYTDLTSFLADYETSESFLIRNGFKIVQEEVGKPKMIVIPAGTVMIFHGANINGWPEFKVRMKFEDYDLDFAGDPFKVKII